MHVYLLRIFAFHIKIDGKKKGKEVGENDQIPEIIVDNRGRPHFESDSSHKDANREQKARKSVQFVRRFCSIDQGNARLDFGWQNERKDQLESNIAKVDDTLMRKKETSQH
jgi:hypothetical protein